MHGSSRRQLFKPVDDSRKNLNIPPAQRDCAGLAAPRITYSHRHRPGDKTTICKAANNEVGPDDIGHGALERSFRRGRCPPARAGSSARPSTTWRRSRIAPSARCSISTTNYYAATSRSLFEADLRNKDFVVTLREPSGALAGFSTLAVLEAEIGGRKSARDLFGRHHHRSCPLGHAGARLHVDQVRRHHQGVGARAAALLVPDRQGPPHLSLSLGLLGRLLSALGYPDAGAGARDHGRAGATALRRRL